MSNPIKEELRQQLDATRAELKQYLDSLTPEQWETVVFADENNWKVSDLLRHLNEAEVSMVRLMDNIRQGGEGASPDFDLNRWNASKVRKAQEKTVAQLMDDMEANRAYMWEFFDSLNPEDWEKRGRHGTGRILSLAEIFQVIAGHDRQHMKDMQRALNDQK